MRNAFAAIITELAAADPRIVLLSGDIGNRLFDSFKGRFPERFFNCGVAEANMTSMAAGMALCGLRPFTYTIAPFGTTRVLEQIRIDACYHNVPVTVVGTGAGLSYASLGPTHHSCEDVAILRCLPNMTILCPADAAEVRKAVEAVLALKGPAYIRLGKKGEPAVHPQPPSFAIGKGIVLQEGNDVCLLGCGTVTAVALEAASVLQSKGIAARVVSMHTVKPLDEGLLEEVFSRFPLVAVVEEHSQIGGLGGSVAEWLAASRPRLPGELLVCGTPDAFLGESGSQRYARERFGLTADSIAARVATALQQTGRG